MVGVVTGSAVHEHRGFDQRGRGAFLEFRGVVLAVRVRVVGPRVKGCVSEVVVFPEVGKPIHVGIRIWAGHLVDARVNAVPMGRRKDFSVDERTAVALEIDIGRAFVRPGVDAGRIGLQVEIPIARGRAREPGVSLEIAAAVGPQGGVPTDPASAGALHARIFHRRGDGILDFGRRVLPQDGIDYAQIDGVSMGADGACAARNGVLEKDAIGKNGRCGSAVGIDEKAPALIGVVLSKDGILDDPGALELANASAAAVGILLGVVFGECGAEKFVRGVMAVKTASQIRSDIAGKRAAGKGGMGTRKVGDAAPVLGRISGKIAFGNARRCVVHGQSARLC